MRALFTADGKPIYRRGTGDMFKRTIDQLCSQLAATQEEPEKALALANTWAREIGVEEAVEVSGLQTLIDALWSMMAAKLNSAETSRQIAVGERDAARAEALVLRAALKRAIPAMQSALYLLEPQKGEWDQFISQPDMQRRIDEITAALSAAPRAEALARAVEALERVAPFVHHIERGAFDVCIDNCPCCALEMALAALDGEAKDV